MSARVSAAQLYHRILAFGRRPELLAFLPALTLGAFWLGGEAALVLTALVVPLGYAVASLLLPQTPRATEDAMARDALTGLILPDALTLSLDQHLSGATGSGRNTACITLCLDDAEALTRRYGMAGFNDILRQTGARIVSTVRQGDIVARTDQASFAVALQPVDRADLESVLQLSARIQEAVETAISLDATTVYVSASVGFCLAARAPAPNGAALLDAARAAMEDAHFNGPGAIRAYTTEMHRARTDLQILRHGIAPALENGEIRPWFQPQISCDTGEITGFETLARWMHPERGLLTPDQFLPELFAAGLSERLGERMLAGALRALRDWEQSGHRVPSIGVNFAPQELRNPRLPDKVQWELDRHGLTPDRLTVEILETVVAEMADDVIVQGIARLARLGCRIDLDDFGTGHAAITNIRRFSVTRIKIDRSFVTRLNEDREQQQMVAAILSLADRLGLETIAEGVETAGEHVMLAQLGCGHIQGFGIARPMPQDQATDWITQHLRSLTKTALPLGRRLG